MNRSFAKHRRFGYFGSTRQGLWRRLSVCAVRMAVVGFSVSASFSSAADRTLLDPDALRQLNAAIAEDRTSAGLEQLQQPVDESTLLRRLYVTLAGRIPTVAEQQIWTSLYPDQRIPMTQQRLLDGPAWVYVRTTWWEDQLRVTSQLPRRARGEPYRAWLHDAVASGKSYQQIVRELVSSSGPFYAEGNGAAGYYVRDTGMPLDNLAASMQVFLGTSISCAQCHDHPYNDWTQRDFYQLAAFSHNAAQYTRVRPQQSLSKDQRKIWSRNMKEATPQERQVLRRIATLAYLDVSPMDNRPLRLPHDYRYDDAAPNDIVSARVPFGQQPAEEFDPSLEAAGRKQFAEWLTNAENPLFSFKAVNDLWTLAFGEGIVSGQENWELDTAENASLPKTLHFLRNYFIHSGYDSRSVMALLTASDLYRQPITLPGSSWDGPRLRRLRAEHLWDSFVALAVENPDQGVLNDARRTSTVAARLSSVADELRQYDAQELIDLGGQVAARRQQERDARSQRREVQKQLKSLRQQMAHARKEKDSGEVKRLTPIINELRDKIKLLQQKVASKNVESQSLGQRMMINISAGPQRAQMSQPVRRALLLPAPAPADHFLRVFGQSDREIPNGWRDQAVVPQVLLFLNGLVDQHLWQPGRVVYEHVKAADDPIEAAFAVTLMRMPTAEEHAAATVLLQEYGPRDVLWSLINTHEFMFFH